jgi:hypothetical protein
MIIKNKDSISSVTEELQALLKLPLDNRQLSMVERELKALHYGVRGEQDSAYFLNFTYGKSNNWAIIHDLRIEWKGRVAQIDHLLINRALDIFVLETRNFFGNVKINEQGEFSVAYGEKIYGIESPIEQSRRHVAVLEERIAARVLAPTRLGIPLPVAFHPYVLISPKSTVDRPNIKAFDSSMVIKADQFEAVNAKRVDQMSVVGVLAKAGKIIGSNTLEAFAKGIAGLHRPGKINYRSKFGISESLTAAPPKLAPATEPTSSSPAIESAGRCDKCGAGVEAKVVAFCRYNRAKLDGHKVLCRDCQKTVARQQ